MLAQNYRSEGVCPPERLISFLRVRARGWCGAAPGVGWATRVCRAAPRRAAPPPRRRRAARAARQEGSVFFEVRFGGRGSHGCVLLIEIYKMSR